MFGIFAMKDQRISENFVAVLYISATFVTVNVLFGISFCINLVENRATFYSLFAPCVVIVGVLSYAFGASCINP